MDSLSLLIHILRIFEQQTNSLLIKLDILENGNKVVQLYRQIIAVDVYSDIYIIHKYIKRRKGRERERERERERGRDYKL